MQLCAVECESLGTRLDPGPALVGYRRSCDGRRVAHLPRGQQAVFVVGRLEDAAESQAGKPSHVLVESAQSRFAICDRAYAGFKTLQHVLRRDRMSREGDNAMRDATSSRNADESARTCATDIREQMALADLPTWPCHRHEHSSCGTRHSAASILAADDVELASSCACSVAFHLRRPSVA